MADEGDAGGEAHLAAVGVAGEVDVGVGPLHADDVVGVVGEDDSGDALGFFGEGLEPVVGEVVAEGAGDGNQFYLRGGLVFGGGVD